MVIDIIKNSNYKVTNLNEHGFIFNSGEKIIISSNEHDDELIRCFCEVLCDSLEVSDEIKKQLMEGEIDELYESSLNKAQLFIKKKEEEMFNGVLLQLQEKIGSSFVNRIEESLNDAKEYADNLYNQWQNAMNEVKRQQGELLSFKYDHTSEKIEGFINTLRMDRENVDIIAMNKRNVTMKIRQPFLFFDEEKWKLLKDTVLKCRKEARHVIEAIVEKRCTLMFETGIVFNFSPTESFPVRYCGVSGTLLAPPNPHISVYNCWGDYKTSITRYIMNGDYDMAYMQIKAALAGINLEDDAVFPYLFDYFLDGVTKMDWEFYNCKCITDNETGIQMTIKEAENYYRSQEEDHEEN